MPHCLRGPIEVHGLPVRAFIDGLEMGWSFTGDAWCERGDSNPHGLLRQILSLVRLPIPPLSRLCCAAGALQIDPGSSRLDCAVCGAAPLPVYNKAELGFGAGEVRRGTLARCHVAWLLPE